MYRCYEYGCAEPNAVDLEIMVSQMRLRNQLWNRFVEIERDFRAKREEILRVPDQDELDAQMEKLAELRKLLRAAKKRPPAKHTKSHAVSEDVSKLGLQIRELEARLLQRGRMAGVIMDGTLTAAQQTKNALAALRLQIREQRIVRATENRDRLKKLEEDRKLQANAAQRESGLYWGNYDDVRTGYETARIRAMKDGVELHFHSFNGSGKLSVRWQNGADVPSVFADDRLLHIAPVDPAAHSSPVRSVRRKLCRTTVTIRTYDQQSNLVSVVLPMHLHRPLPEAGKIRTAAIVRRNLGNRCAYTLVVGVDIGTPAAAEEGAIGGAVTVALRHLRPVADYRDDAGRLGVITLSEDRIAEFEKCNDLQSLIDQKHNAAKEVLETFLKVSPVRLPDWLKEVKGKLHLWRSPKHLWMLVRDWKRFRGDEALYIALSAWATQHRHLWLWKRNLEDQVVRARREEYRIVAAKLAEQYDVLRIESTNLAAKVKRPGPEEDRLVVGARSRDIAARAVLRGVLVNAFQMRGKAVEEISSSQAAVSGS